MSLWFQSPMPKKFQVFFFLWVLCTMALFASVSVSIAFFHWGWAGTLLFIALLFVGFGFMIRKRVLRSLGMIPEREPQQ
ncbi:MAG: hypothetical protein ACXVC1_08075 [Tumebacillaceae bacterium]